WSRGSLPGGPSHAPSPASRFFRKNPMTKHGTRSADAPQPDQFDGAAPSGGVTRMNFRLPTRTTGRSTDRTLAFGSDCRTSFTWTAPCWIIRCASDELLTSSDSLRTFQSGTASAGARQDLRFDGFSFF